MPTLEFKGKPFVYSHHLSVPFRELIVDAKKSLPGGKNASLDDNLIIHGDNLEALKALLPRYAGKVDVVYIDPPFNTGAECWVYNDSVKSPLMKEWLGKVVDREDLERHDKWLCMMWPRLQLLKELLSPRGVLLVSIGDDEVHRLRDILDEILGEDNSLGVFVWKRRSSSAMRSIPLSTDHEYVLCYALDKTSVVLSGLEKSIEDYPYADEKGNFASTDLTVGKNQFERPNQFYRIQNPRTGKWFDPNPHRVWRFEPGTMKNVIAANLIIWPDEWEGKLERPRFKTYFDPNSEKPKPVSTWIEKFEAGSDSVLEDDEWGLFILTAGKTEEGGKQIRDIFGQQKFEYPKPVSLICSLLALCSRKDSTILDSFAGSGTTAHAVLALNHSDGGSRRFILVETEDYADELTAERVRRVIKGVPDAKNEALRKGLGGSFTYCELGEPIDLDRFFDGKSAPRYGQVARYVIYTATGQSMTDVPDEPVKHWFVGEAGGYRIHLIYKPNLDFMRSNEAALSLPLAQEIAKCAQGKPVLVYAAAKFMAQAELTKLGMTFCQLPYSIHRVLGEAPDAP